MNVVYKHKLTSPSVELELPVASQILSIAEQKDELFIWVKHDTDAPTENRYFCVFGTGQQIPCDMGGHFEFLQTVHMQRGLVWHVFERTGL